MRPFVGFVFLSFCTSACTSFVVYPLAPTCCPCTTSRRSPSPVVLASASSPVDGEDREFARVRRRRGRREAEDDGDYYNEDDDNSAYEERRQRRQDAVYDNDDWIDYDRLDDLLDDDDEDDDYLYDEEEYEMLSDVLIPNPLLDSMDPDGAAERFPELARDPRFWFDMVLFVAFLNFLSFTGPQDPYPDIPWF